MKLEKYSMGTGDRFGKQAGAQLESVIKAGSIGKEIAIIWNKSYREHAIIHTDPASVRAAADEAVKASGWEGSYYVILRHLTNILVDELTKLNTVLVVYKDVEMEFVYMMRIVVLSIKNSSLQLKLKN